MSEGIKSAAVIGSGVMGSAIAAQFAGAGIRTQLLDVVPRELPPGSETDASTGPEACGAGQRSARARVVTGAI